MNDRKLSFHTAKHWARTALFTPVGRVTGAPRIQLASPLIRGGNFLYYWLWAYTTNSHRRPARVLHQDSIDAWLHEFPLARDLTILKRDAPRLRSTWYDATRHRFGIDFTRENLEEFCRNLIRSSPQFQKRQARIASAVGPGTCVINIRRGDYYAYPHIERLYGLDNAQYVDSALTMLRRDRRNITDFLLVSDDIEWTMKHIAPLLDRPARPVPQRSSMFDDLAALSVGRTAILANSTFSFWGAYLARSADSNHRSVAPPFHLRDQNGNRYRDTYDPNWLICEFPGSEAAPSTPQFPAGG